MGGLPVTDSAECATCGVVYSAPEPGMSFLCSPRCFGSWLAASAPWGQDDSGCEIEEPRTVGGLLRLSRLYMEQLSKNPTGGATGATWRLRGAAPGMPGGLLISYLGTARARGFIPRFPLVLPWEVPTLTAEESAAAL